ncbi:methyltransferase domain-containing protein [Gilvimarinus xylanilyticus]|uniref:tRNA 5-carboxymethoxyuridine methyltransferase n=1 Tax=Gilvimarinus xylanilyticus TaxID=2944139 RepID=A0A9X2I304_9GAMM|nr:methyltransferase domain-containing protein [Gilvimarinus xylanilyticus]MCP8898582.1 methyltransferase domain-containing protein [Gilvimarinus xylanilyticus]
MAKQENHLDRNFDDLAERFDRNIYGGLKGAIRLAVLNRDFADFLPIAPYVPMSPQGQMTILDAGGGQGHFSLPLAAAGHRVLLSDISANMLARARDRAQHLGCEQNVTMQQVAAQEVAPGERFDIVLCHALLEWVVEPMPLLDQLLSKVKPGGTASLIFYNQHGLVYKNLLRANYKKVQRRDYLAQRGSLTPINPLQPEVVREHCRERGFTLLCSSGIRVFCDYILDPERRQRDPDSVLELELAHSRQAPFADLGRYIHLLLRRNS